MPTENKRRSVLLGPELDRLVDRDRATNFNDLVRRLVARHYGKPKLAQEVKRGRPRKE